MYLELLPLRLALGVAHTRLGRAALLQVQKRAADLLLRAMDLLHLQLQTRRHILLGAQLLVDLGLQRGFQQSKRQSVRRCVLGRPHTRARATDLGKLGTGLGLFHRLGALPQPRLRPVVLLLRLPQTRRLALQRDQLSLGALGRVAQLLLHLDALLKDSHQLKNQRRAIG